ncbi:LacI family DNA-binding transcriptional regulator [Thalassospira marina]|uniref:LacI family transcriptional regulator n=1 Tax=Thalassospira marina TaxID=2048283 RepID=A0A2N3KMP7_9PROT|nr:LacI family DNA-binding transcriptional regulator [Thalassospira marina]PKR51822.1 LacI family transcriptional regulator [Thalassospira marina]
MSKPSSRNEPMTIARLAQHLGLAEGTISRALNNYPDIAEKTRQRVQKAAREMGYRPSSSARRLARGVIETIGFVLPTCRTQHSDPFLAEILNGLATELSLHDWDLLVTSVPDGHDEVDVIDRLVGSNKVDGFVIARTRREDARVNYLRQSGVPFVVQGRTDHPDDYSWLDIDNEQAFVEAVTYLRGLGHVKIACLGGDPTMNFAWQRRSGYLRAMAEQNGHIGVGYLIDGITDELTAFRAAQRLLAITENDRPTALLCVTDAVAIGAMHALTRAGLRVGEDISIMGFDGLPIGRAVQPALTTLHQDSYEIGREAGRMVLDLCTNPPSAPKQTLWQAKLTPRASVNPPAQSPAQQNKGGF